MAKFWKPPTYFAVLRHEQIGSAYQGKWDERDGEGPPEGCESLMFEGAKEIRPSPEGPFFSSNRLTAITTTADSCPVDCWTTGISSLGRDRGIAHRISWFAKFANFANLAYQIQCGLTVCTAKKTQKKLQVTMGGKDTSPAVLRYASTPNPMDKEIRY